MAESVGQVSVEVVPDADNFAKQAEAQLKRQRIDPKDVRLNPIIDANMAALSSQVTAIAKSLDRESQIRVHADFSGVSAIEAFVERINPPKTVLPVEWDPNSEEGLRRALEQIQRTFGEKHVLNVDASTAVDQITAIRNTLDQISKEKVRIAAEIVLNEATIKAAKERLAATEAKMHARIEWDEAFNKRKVEEQLAWTEARIEAGMRLMSAKNRLNVDMHLDDSASRQEYEAMRDDFARLEIETQVKPTVSAKATAATKASLDHATRDRVLKVFVKTGKGIAGIASVLSGFDALHKSITRAREMFTGLFTNLPGVAAATTGIFALAGALISSAANMAGLAGSAAQALPALLAIGGIAVGMAITAAAFKDFATVLPGVAEQFKGLQGVISDAFWAPGTGAIAGIQAFSASIMGPLTAGLQQASGAIGGFVGNLATQLGGALGGDGGPLATWFANLTASVQTFEPFIANLVNIFVQFGNVGSAMLVPLAQLFGSLADRFDAWFASLVAGQGEIEAFAAKGTAALAGIIETVIQLGAIFGAVFRAAEESGAASFTSVAERLEGFAQTLNDNQAKMVGLFDAAQLMWSNFADAAGGSVSAAMGNITSLLTAVLPVIGVVLGTVTELLAGLITPEVTAGLAVFVDGIAAGIEAMKPAIAPLAGLIATLGPVLGMLAGVIGGVFGALAPSITGIVEALGPLIAKLGGGLLTIIQKLETPINLLATALADALGNPAVMAAIDAIVNAVVALIPALTPIIGMAASLISMLLPLVAVILEPIAGLIGQLVPLFTPLAGVITGIVGALAPVIPMLLDLILGVLGPLLPLIVQLVSSLLPVLVPIVQNVANVLALVMGILTPLLEAGFRPLVAILGVVISVIGVVAGIIATVLGAAFTWISEQITKVSDGIAAFFGKWEEIWNKVVDFFKGIWEGLLTWIKNLLGIHSPSSWFLDLAKNMFQGMLDGLKAAWKWITEFFSGAWEWLKTIVTETFESVKNTVLAAWEAIKGFFSDAWEGLKGIVTGGWEKIKTFFSDGATKLKDIASDAWVKVKTFFSEGITNAVNLVKGLPGKVLNSLKGIGTTLWNAGKDLIQGLINGASSLLTGIGNWFLDKLPAWIRDPFKAALGINSPSTVFFGFGENIIEGLIDGMESQHRKVFSSMDDLAKGVADTPFNLPNVGGGLSTVAAMVAAATSAGGTNRTLNYYAAPGTSIGSEEDLFAAAGRGRMVW